VVAVLVTFGPSLGAGVLGQAAICAHVSTVGWRFGPLLLPRAPPTIPEAARRPHRTRVSEAEFGCLIVARHNDCRPAERGLRGARSLQLWSTMLGDIRHAFRLFRRSPGFSLVACITLALGIGATTVIFSVLDAALFRPLPYKHADRLVDVFVESQTRDGSRVLIWPPRCLTASRRSARPARCFSRLDRISLLGLGLSRLRSPRCWVSRLR
jgi:hypothetical protein